MKKRKLEKGVRSITAAQADKIKLPHGWALPTKVRKAAPTMPVMVKQKGAVLAPLKGGAR